MLHRETRTLVTNCFVKLGRNNTEQAQQKYRIINISRGGLCFQCDDQFDLNETVQLNVLINEKDVHSANGRVCYRNKLEKPDATQYGLSFLDKFIDTDIIRETSHNQAV